ncbi:MAG: hypothetical protein ACOCRK_00025 [bacterium]
MLYSGILKLAIKEAEKSEMYPFKIGCVVFDGKRILGSGHNKKGVCGKIPPKYRNENDSIHAEQMAILNVPNWDKLSGVSLITVRINRKNGFAMSKPCDMCMSMIKHVGIKEIYYTTYAGEIVKEKILKNGEEYDI